MTDIKYRKQGEKSVAISLLTLCSYASRNFAAQQKKGARSGATLVGFLIKCSAVININSTSLAQSYTELSIGIRYAQVLPRSAFLLKLSNRESKAWSIIHSLKDRIYRI